MIVLLNSLNHTINTNSEIVKERIWINPVTSKILVQLVDTDTDAQLHKERVISVRKVAKFPSRVLQEKCHKWNADTLETSCRCDVEEFQEEINVAQKTAVTPQVQR